MELNHIEARVIGCLLEKEITTPEQYPLSLNSLTQACNQKTSRDPVLSLTETEVQQALDELAKKRLVSEQSGFGSRVVKYKHRFCNTEFSDLQLTAAQIAVIDLLLLRGPQTPGELRTRASRLYEFTDINQVESILTELINFEIPLVKQLPRESGKRESRFTECFSVSANLDVSSPNSSHSESSPSNVNNNQPASLMSVAAEFQQAGISSNENDLALRVSLLEDEVAELKQQLLKILQAGEK